MSFLCLVIKLNFFFLRFCLYGTRSKRIQMDPVRKSDRIGLLFTRDSSGTDPERILKRIQNPAPAEKQVQFWIRLDPVLVQFWIRFGLAPCKHLHGFHVYRSQSDPVQFGRGPWRGKMGTGICLFLHWENGILVTGTGNHKHKSGNGKHV